MMVEGRGGRWQNQQRVDRVVTRERAGRGVVVVYKWWVKMRGTECGPKTVYQVTAWWICFVWAGWHIQKEEQDERKDGRRVAIATVARPRTGEAGWEGGFIASALSTHLGSAVLEVECMTTASFPLQDKDVTESLLSTLAHVWASHALQEQSSRVLFPGTKQQQRNKGVPACTEYCSMHIKALISK